jgi:hypothetical protein
VPGGDRGEDEEEGADEEEEEDGWEEDGDDEHNMEESYPVLGAEDVPEDLHKLIAHLSMCSFALTLRRNPDPLAAQKLGVNDLGLLKAWNYKLKHNISDSAFSDLHFVFPEYKLPTARTAHRRIAFLAAFKPQIYHCCVRSCMCYAGIYSDLDSCLYCKELRLKNGKPHKVFSYIPLIPRLIALYMNPEMVRKMMYRHDYKINKGGKMRDYLDGLVYQSLLKREIPIGNTGYKFFQFATDIALGLFTDGFSPSRTASKRAGPSYS